MLNLENRWFIDGIDIYTTFKIFIEDGSADFLKYAPKKEGLEHDWKDANGREVDLSRIFFDQRQGVLDMAIIVQTEDEFWQYHALFISQMIQPGLRRLTLASHGERSYFVYYKEINNYQQVVPLKGTNGFNAHRFSMVVVEPEPEVDASHRFLIDEEGRFIIT